MISFTILSGLFVFICCILCGITPNSYPMIVLTFGGSCFFSGIGLSPIWMFWFVPTSTITNTKLMLYFLFACPFQKHMYHDIHDPDETNVTPLMDTTPILEPSETKYGYSISMSPYLCIPTILCYNTFLGMIFAMILLPLDQGAQIQRWPIPMLLGTWIGYGVGVILSILWEYFGLYIMLNVHGNDKIKA